MIQPPEAPSGIERGKRPCLVIQHNTGNQHSPLTIVAPLTDKRQDKSLPVQVLVVAAELGLDGKDSVIDRDRRIDRVVGHSSDATLARVDTAIRVSLGLG